MEQAKRRLTAENAELLRQLQELENNANLLLKTKAGLVSQLDEQKSIADNEARERTSLLGKYRNMEHEVDGLKSTFNDEASSRENIERQVSKALSDADLFRQKYEIDGMAKAEELEMSRLKMQARLSESQSTIEQLSAKLAQIEMAKAKLHTDLATELDSGTAYMEYHRMLDAHPFNFVLLLLFSTSCMKNYLVSIQNILK